MIHSQHTPSTSQPTPLSGFTLVEVALASLIIGLGILTLFGLARIGTQSAAEAEDETRAALFAENVFGALEAVNTTLNATHDPAGWSQVWQAFQSGERFLEDAALQSWEWEDPQNPPTWMLVFGDGRIHTNIYYSASHRASMVEGILENRIVYRLQVELTAEAPSLHPEASRAAVSLNVWPTRSVRVRHDDAVQADFLTEPYSFFRLFLNHGPLHAPATP